MSERRNRGVPERIIVSYDIAYGSSTKDQQLQMLLNDVVGKSSLNEGRIFKDPNPSTFVTPIDRKD